MFSFTHSIKTKIGRKIIVNIRYIVFSPFSLQMKLVLVGANGHASVAPACGRANKLAASGLDADILATEVTQVLLCITAVAFDFVHSISYDVLHNFPFPAFPA